jgi:adenylate cyclase
MTASAATGLTSYRLDSGGQRLAGGFVLVLLCGLMAFLPLRNLENSWGLSGLYFLRGDRLACPQVILIALNASAAKNLNVPTRPDRWPRALHAELITQLHAQGAQLIAFDMLFDRARDAPDDAALAQAIAQAGNVVLVAYLQRETVQAAAAGTGKGAVATLDRLVPPLPQFADGALAVAPFALVKSPYGVQEYLTFAPQGSAELSLPQVIAQHMGRGPTHTRATTRLNLYGPPGQVRTFSYDRALAWLRQGAHGALQFQGSVVLVGAIEPNQSEQRDAYQTAWTTEQEIDLSGVELAATALCNQLDGSALRKLSAVQESGILALMAALFWGPWRLKRGALWWSAGLALAYAATAVFVFAKYYVWLPLALPLVVVFPLAQLWGLAGKLRRTQFQKNRLHKALAKYGPREEIAQLAQQMSHQDDTIHVACLCTDIANYTPQIEGLTPAQAHAWLNAYFAIVFPIVRQHGGHVVDHAGDAMVCIWLCGTQAGAACAAARLCALALQSQLHASPHYQTRFGLHFGPVALGEVGDAQHAEQRVVGDIVNTASRIQAANKPLGTQLLMSQALADQLQGEQQGRMLGSFLLKGKTQAVGLLEVASPVLSVQALYVQALNEMESGQIHTAIFTLTQLLKSAPKDGPARYLLGLLTDSPNSVYGQQCLAHQGERKKFTFSLE